MAAVVVGLVFWCLYVNGVRVLLTRWPECVAVAESADDDDAN